MVVLRVVLTVLLDLEDGDPHLGDATSHSTEERPMSLESSNGISASVSS